MKRFYWLIPGVLAGCELPGRVGRSLGPPEAVARDLAYLREQGVEALLSLTEWPLADDLLVQHGLDALHLPVPDMAPPAVGQLRQALAFIDDHRAYGRPVAVHCLMGQGRTGTVLAAYLIREGQSPLEALAAVRQACPGAVENPRQERALAAFAEERGWLV